MSAPRDQVVLEQLVLIVRTLNFRILEMEMGSVLSSVSLHSIGPEWRLVGPVPLYVPLNANLKEVIRSLRLFARVMLSARSIKFYDLYGTIDIPASQ